MYDIRLSMTEQEVCRENASLFAGPFGGPFDRIRVRLMREG